MLKLTLLCAVIVAVSAVTHVPYFNAYKPELAKTHNDHELALPSSYVSDDALPDSWQWGDMKGKSYLTKSLNQHIPQYCGSCWAHGAVSAFSDRIKIARKAENVDINLAIQYILNCGDAGSCHGGSHTAVYEYIKKSGFIPFDTCQQYAACSAESKEGMCANGDWTCSAMNTCRTCSTFSDMGGTCTGLDHFPNASIAEYGEVSGASDMQKEIYARGPIACGVNAQPLDEYEGGIIDQPSASQGINHIVSIVGWSTDKKTGDKFWTVRNSWGEYWGEAGYFRIKMGGNQLGIESDCAWATPASWTEKNFPCYEDGSNCKAKSEGGQYVDPAVRKPWYHKD